MRRSDSSTPSEARLRGWRPVLLAMAIRPVTLAVIVMIVGPRRVFRTFLLHVRPEWIVFVALAELVTFLAYTVAYRSLAQLGEGSAPSFGRMARIVVAGFGPLSLSGGFALDRLTLARDRDETTARMLTAAMGCLEWTVLGPLAWAGSVVLLARDVHLGPSVLWPWVIGVPAVGGIALVLIHPRVWGLLRRKLRRPDWLARYANRQLEAVVSVVTVARHPRHYVEAWVGTLAYWALEIAALYCALRACGAHVGPARATVAYASGCLGSRRSMPLGGAGLTEVLFIYALYTLNVRLGPAVAAVVIYRTFNFTIGIIPALFAQRQLERV